MASSVHPSRLDPLLLAIAYNLLATYDEFRCEVERGLNTIHIHPYAPPHIAYNVKLNKDNTNCIVTVCIFFSAKLVG